MNCRFLFNFVTISSILYAFITIFIEYLIKISSNKIISNYTINPSYCLYDGRKIKTEYFPKISVIIPCYQKGRYLPRAFKSCIEDQYLQKYNFNIEIIGIDDASSDNTTEIFKELKKKYESEDIINSTDKGNIFKNHVNIKLFRFNKNKGTLYTRLFALNQSNADYLMSLDADDEFIPGIMQRLLMIKEAKPDLDVIQFRLLSLSEQTEFERNEKKKNGNEVNFSYGLFFYGWLGFNVTDQLNFNDSIEVSKYQIGQKLLNQNQTDLQSISKLHFINASELRKMILVGRVMWNIPSILIRKDIMKIGVESLDFDPNAKKISEYEDRLILYASYYFCEKYYFIDEPGYIYHSGIYTPRRKPRLRYVNFLLAKLFQSGKKIV